jgi:hypothetical protein
MKPALRRAATALRRRPRVSERGNEREGEEKNQAKKVMKKKKFGFSLGGLKATTCSTVEGHPLPRYDLSARPTQTRVTRMSML